MSLTIDDALAVIGAVERHGVSPGPELERRGGRGLFLHALNQDLSAGALSKILHDPHWASKRVAAINRVLDGLYEASQDPHFPMTALGVPAWIAAAEEEIERLTRLGRGPNEDVSAPVVAPLLDGRADFPQDAIVIALARTYERFFSAKPRIPRGPAKDSPHGPFVDFVQAVFKAVGASITPNGIYESRKRALANRRRGTITEQ